MVIKWWSVGGQWARNRPRYLLTGALNVQVHSMYRCTQHAGVLNVQVYLTYSCTQHTGVLNVQLYSTYRCTQHTGVLNVQVYSTQRCLDIQVYSMGDFNFR